jgi:hypothetical protein
MKTLLASLALLVATAAFAGTPAKITSLKTALKTARTQGKFLFVQMGREACGNCQELKGMISQNKVPLSDARYVYADVDCDDLSTNDLFSRHFKVEGDTLPFVVIAAPDGTQLAARSGAGTAKDYNRLISDAEKAAVKMTESQAAKKK